VTYVNAPGREVEVPSTVDSFLANLPELLGAMSRDERCLLMIASLSHGRYVQFWVDPDATTCAEVVANQFLEPEWRLDSPGESALREMGWREPGASSPNWVLRARSATERLEVVRSFGRVIVELFGESPASEVGLRTWEHRDHPAVSA
jgi:hypothetical protein